MSAATTAESGGRGFTPRLTDMTLGEPVERSTMFIDMVESSDMKHKEPEASWVAQMQWLYQTIRDEVLDNLDDQWSKGTGDGAMVVSSDDPVRMINAAIRLQEAVTAAADGAGRKVGFRITIAITSGFVYEVPSPDGDLRYDYLGIAVDRAARLCGAASPGGILVDRATIQDSALRRIESIVGKALKYDSDKYAGDVQQVPLKGFPEPVSYHEIRWSGERFGLRSSRVTEAVDELSARHRTVESASSAGGRPTSTITRMTGIVKAWKPGSFGFISTEGGEDFFFAPNLLAYAEDAEDIRIGDRVAFAVGDGPTDGKSRRASSVLFEGSEAKGRIVAVSGTYAWTKVDVPGGLLVYTPFSEATRPLAKNEAVTFTLKINARGAYAGSVEID